MGNLCKCITGSFPSKILFSKPADSTRTRKTKMVRLGEGMEISEEVIMKACLKAKEAHKYPGEPYLSDNSFNSSSSSVVISFPGSWSVKDWFSRGPFGETKVDLELFPSQKCIGLDKPATVNEAFLQRFRAVLADPRFKAEVGNAVTNNKQIVFTGHSSGGAIAMLATVWFLEEYIRKDPSKIPPLCLTFGSPLVGDWILSHAIRRENWSRCFTHFVMRYDIIPRILLTPLSSIEQQLQAVLNFFNPESLLHKQEPTSEARDLFKTVMKYSSSVASHAACKIMGNTDPILETVSSFIQFSPYRPFGAYVFCVGNGKLVVVSDPEAVLQILFYSSQLGPEEKIATGAHRSLTDHLNYQDELQESLQMHNVTSLDDLHLRGLSLSSDDIEINLALNDLGLSERARFCLCAVEELGKEKLRNQTTIDEKKKDILEQMVALEKYRSNCEVRKIGYYDAFKISEEEQDFNANVARLKLAGIWDEIIDLLKRNELPDKFEGQEEWVELGTRYRRISEPLDIANFYRHLKNEDTGAYMGMGRPKRYKCTQRWREHGKRMTEESLESCFWAEVEELWNDTGSPGIKERVLNLESKAQKWIQNGDLSRDVLLEKSTFKRLQNEVFSRPT